MTDDLISRRAAIDMFQNLAYDDWNQGTGTTWASAFGEAAEMVKNLPSAEPQERKGRCTNGYWIAPNVWHEGYTDKCVNRWDRREDNDIEMLECPKCKCRVFAEQFIYAVGVQGFNFCPYCGEDLRPKQMTIFTVEVEHE